MKDFNMSDAGDLVLTEGRLTFVDGDELIRQNLLKRLRTFSGEWFLDVNIGLPYIQAIFVKGVDPDDIEDFFLEEILAVEGVKEMVQFNLELDASIRQLTVEFEVTTVNGGTIEIEETI